MTNITLHGLSQTRFSLSPSLIMKKCQGKNNLQRKIHAFKFKVNWILQNSHAKFASKFKMLEVTMVSKPNGALGVEIEPTIYLVP